MNNKPRTICYFGIYRPVAPRDKVYLDGLKKRGVEVTLCVDNSRGLLKFFRLARKLYALQGEYDMVWVGYLSTMVAPLARLLSRKKIIYNALDSWYDRSIRDRGMHSRFSPVAWVMWLCDFLAFRLSDIVLLESEQQRRFIAKTFFVNPKKLKVVFTGVDESVFHPDPAVKKRDTFTVLFRGMFLPATGVEQVIEAARLLQNENIRFRIVGWGEPLQTRIQKMIAEHTLSHVDLTTVFLSPDELRMSMLSCHVMLGQFADHQRMERTIQNKNMEALAFGLPLITRDSPSNRELLTDGADCIFVPPANPRAIADAILRLRDDVELREKLSSAARATYAQKLTPDILSAQLVKLLQ